MTHIRLKTGEKVNVERFEGNVLVVRSAKGKVLGSYEYADMAKFHKRYQPIGQTKKKGG